MKLGILVRDDRRGLANQTLELHRHLDPVRTLVIDNPNSPYPRAGDWFPDPWCVARPDELDEALIERFCDGLDTVLTAETFYSDAFVPVARRMGVRTVVHANPELFHWATFPDVEVPDVVALPTAWRLDEVREVAPDAVVLPLPVATDRLPARRVEKVETILHLVGHRAMADRDGTQLFFAAMRYLSEPVRVVVRTQSHLSRSFTRAAPSNVDLVVEEGNVDNYWDLYDGVDALVLPRRYGGQSLKLAEALGCGLPCVVSDRVPETDMVPAEARVPVKRLRKLNTLGGEIAVESAQERALARTVDRLVSDPEMAARLSDAALEWREAHSWEALLPRWREVLYG